MTGKSAAPNNKGKAPAPAQKEKANKVTDPKESDKDGHQEESPKPDKRLKVKEPNEGPSFSAFKGSGSSEEGPEYGPRITMNTRSAARDESVQWLIEVWLVNVSSTKDMLCSDTGFHPCGGATYVPTLKMWRCTARTWQQAFFIAERVVAELVKKGKTCKWEKKKLKLTVPIGNKMEAFMTSAGRPYWTLKGSDTYFCADLCKKYNGKFCTNQKYWDGIDYQAKKDDIAQRCEKFGIPIEIIEEEEEEPADEMTEVADP